MASPGRLHVFLHGLTVVSENGPPGYELYMVLPQVSGHVFKAGSWLNETDIKPGALLSLRGVTSGSATFEPSTAPLDLRSLSGSPSCFLNPSGPRIAATLLWPRPMAILGLLRASFPSGDPVVTIDNGTPNPTPIATDVATVHVLIYEYSDENDVVLDGHYWEPYSIGGAISLHIISTSQQQEGAQHETETQAVLGSIIKNYPKLTIADPPIPSWRFPKDPTNPRNPKAGFGNLALAKLQQCTIPWFQDCVATDPGNEFAFSLAELEDYSQRCTRLNRLGRIQQLGRPLASLWDEPDPLGEPLRTCFLITVH